jgi:hypothetical protein
MQFIHHLMEEIKGYTDIHYTVIQYNYKQCIVLVYYALYAIYTPA